MNSFNINNLQQFPDHDCILIPDICCILMKKISALFESSILYLYIRNCNIFGIGYVHTPTLGLLKNKMNQIFTSFEKYGVLTMMNAVNEEFIRLDSLE